MLETLLGKASILKRVIEAIKEVVNEVNIDCSHEGLKMQCMDSSHVAFISLELRYSGFDRYRCDIDRSMGLSMESVNKVFKFCGPNDSVHISCEDEGELVTFVFENAVDEKLATFGLKLMNIDQEALGIPERSEEPDIVMCLPSKEFSTICKMMAEFSDTVIVEVDKNGAKFNYKGDVGEGGVFLKPRVSTNDGDPGVHIKVKRPVKQSFSLRYLNNIAKGSSLSDSVEIIICKDSPIEITFVISEKGNSDGGEKGLLKYYLAPKIEEDQQMEDDATM